MNTREHVGIAIAGMSFGLTLLFFIGRDFIQDSAKLKPINTSLTFTATNRLVVTHYIIIPATYSDWSALTSRYPANVTRTTLKFE